MGDRRTPRGGNRGPRQDDVIESGLEEWESEAAQQKSNSGSADTEDSGELE